ncbi:MAG: NAD(P)-dependent oxidoreductase [Vicinamibacterales bacterium]
MHPVLLYTGPADSVGALERAVGQAFQVRRTEPERDALAAGLREATAFIDASMKVRVDRSMIAAAPLLAVVSTATTGADHIDKAALAERGIPLLTLAGQRDFLRQLTPAAEHSWLLLMACARQLRAATDHVCHGGWNRTDFPGVMLKGRTLGIVGCGRIGQCMARYASAFDMTVVGYDPFVDPWPTGIERRELVDVVAVADFVSVHVPLSDETRGLVGREVFARMKPGCIFVNTSRGDVSDEAALLDALETGRVRAAGLDVLMGEPDVERHPLRLYAETHANLVITPHIGGFSPDAVDLAVAFAARRAADAVGGRS